MNKTTEALKLAEEAFNYRCTPMSNYSVQTSIDKEKKALAAIREALADHSGDANEMVYSKPSVFDGVCCGCSKKAADGWALYCVECWEKAQPQDTECPCGSECEKCSARCLPQESFSDCIWYTYIDFNEKPPYFRYDTGDNTAKENESTYYEIQEELKQFGYTIEDVYIDHDTICGDIVSINKELAQPQGEDTQCLIYVADVDMPEGFRDHKERIAELEQDPQSKAALDRARDRFAGGGKVIEWVDLMDDEIALAVGSPIDEIYLADFRAVIAKFKEKNTPPVVPQGEPVYYQWRRKNQPWSIRHVYHNKVEATTDDSEVRELYTAPPSVEAAIEATKEKAIAALQGVATGRLDVVEAIKDMR